MSYGVIEKKSQDMYLVKKIRIFKESKIEIFFLNDNYNHERK